MTQLNRKLPLGIQDFEEMRRDHYIYADKTDMVWKLANGTKYNYLSRPRRFGKSLLCSTLKCYFEGRKELFEGLKMMELESEWVKTSCNLFQYEFGWFFCTDAYRIFEQCVVFIREDIWQKSG